MNDVPNSHTAGGAPMQAGATNSNLTVRWLDAALEPESPR